jgi:AmmeMemoRadiSam system protein A
MAALLSAGERRQLLALAREALTARVSGFAPVDVAGGPVVAAGAFVSVHHHGDLRGCLGRIEARAPLGETVGELAAAVADSDPRFAPVRTDELNHIEIEISVLTPPERVESIAQVIVGRHGLIVERDGRRGLLLPQVAMAQAWDAATLAAHTCVKAGLPADAWQHGATLLVFEAQVFSE